MKKDDLQQFHGKDGEKSYVSYKGKVYDVTDSRLWKNGRHVNKHEAGMDLTEAMDAAPHGWEVLERFEHVDTIEGFRMQTEKTGTKATIKKLYRIFHPHPMLIHFPMGLIVFTVMMQFLFLVSSKESFETSGFYSLVVAVLFMVPTILSGMVSWWVNYELAVNRIFVYKLIFSVVLLVMGVAELYMRFSDPHIGYTFKGSGWLYNLLLFANLPVMSVVGFNGGKLSWG